MTEKLHSLHAVAAELAGNNNPEVAIVSVTVENIPPPVPSVEPRHLDILQQAQSFWWSLDTFRRERERNKRYNYGRQWDDIINVDGQRMTEEQYIRSQGNVPLKNNLIRRLTQTVMGMYRNQMKEPACIARDRDEQRFGETMSTVLQANGQLNRLKELNARCMEEFLISGMVVQRKWYGYRDGRMDCWTDYVQPNCFFIDTNQKDFRGWDTSCVGEIHDISFADVCTRFAHSQADMERLGDIYRGASDRTNLSMAWEQYGYPIDGYAMDFFAPRDPTQCRVIEVWRREAMPLFRCHDPNTAEVFNCTPRDLRPLVLDVNEARLQQGLEQGFAVEEIPFIQYEWAMNQVWKYYYLAPDGRCLEEGISPYAHGSHPYVFKAWPFIDGEIHSFVSNVIDQQRYVNRLITMYDWIMRASAKGVLLFPESCLPKGMTMEQVADEWQRFNGVIMIKQPPAGGALPQQIANNCTNIGIGELLNMQLRFFEEITGVSGSLQGKPGFSGQSAALYAQQTQNSSTTLLDILDSFSAFICEGAVKDVKNIQQFYTTPRVVAIAGRSGETVEYNPETMGDVEFDLSIVEGVNTPAYRMLANDILMQLYQTQAITVEQLLEHGDFPFADNLLQSIKTQKEEQAQAQAAQAQAAQAQGEQTQGLEAQGGQGVDPQMLAALQQQAQSAQAQGGQGAEAEGGQTPPVDMEAVMRAEQMLKNI